MNGVSLQLNCYSPVSKINFQQFMFQYLDNGSLNYSITTWTNQVLSSTRSTNITYPTTTVIFADTPLLGIDLWVDESNATITGASFHKNKWAASIAISFMWNNLDTSIGSAQLSSITGCTFNIVSSINGTHATLSSEKRTITFAVQNGLIVKSNSSRLPDERD